MPPAARIVIDQYAPLSHKALVGDPHRPQQGLWTVPGWVPATERRRLAAYLVRAAYRNNVARLLMLTTGEQRDDHREYGDAELIVDRIVAGVLGDGWSIVVDGTEDDLPDQPELPDRPVEPGPDATPQERRIHDIRLARWDQQATAAVDEWEQGWAARPALMARQTALRQWAEDNQFAARLDEAEHDCVGLGDTVIVAWPRTGDWPRLSVYDPGFYFPVIDEGSDEDYPIKVHLAWEYGADGAGSVNPTHVRRITFELVELTELHVATDRTGNRYWLGPEGERAAYPALADIEQVDEQGRVYRLSPWDLDIDGNPTNIAGPLGPDGQPTEVPRRTYRTCLVTDATWPVANVGTALDALDDTNATYRQQADGTVMNRLDLGCDFLPFVHIPNTPTGQEHYGRSGIDLVAQVLDDLAQSDTDIMAATRFFAGPVLSLSGSKMDGLNVVAPGIVYNLGEQGRMDVLDLSAGFSAQVGHNAKLQDRLSVSSRVPAEMIGRVSSAKAISGVAMALAFSPFGQVVGVARTTREPKRRLVLRFVCRLAQLQRILPPGPDIPARIQPGTYLPTDRDATITGVAAALNAKAISRNTGVAMLVAAGIPIEDAKTEVERIAETDTAGAVDIANATASEQLAADWLGLELPNAGQAPAPINLPPAPGGAG